MLILRKCVEETISCNEKSSALIKSLPPRSILNEKSIKPIHATTKFSQPILHPEFPIHLFSKPHNHTLSLHIKESSQYKAHARSQSITLLSLRHHAHPAPILANSAGAALQENSSGKLENLIIKSRAARAKKSERMRDYLGRDKLEEARRRRAAQIIIYGSTPARARARLFTLGGPFPDYASARLYCCDLIRPPPPPPPPARRGLEEKEK